MKILNYRMMIRCHTRFITICFSIFIICIAGCKTIYKGDPKKSATLRESLTPTDTIIRKQLNGIDFYAEGKTPVAWSVSLDFDKGFIFKTAAQNLIAAPVKSSRDAMIKADTYSSKTDAGMMNVIAYDETCAGNTKTTISRKVEVRIGDKLYSGCGKYLFDFLLNDIWELELIDSKELASSDYKKQSPRLEFDLEKNKMIGYDGCNNINADISIQGNHITFSTFSGTGSNCSTQKLFSDFLSNRTVDYYIKDDKLVLYLINDSKLTFKKVK